MALRRQTLVVTTDGSGAASVATQRPLNGYVQEIRNNSANWGTAADYVFTRSADEGGGTVASLTNLAGPFSAYVGGTVYPGIPCDGHLTMTIAQGATATAGTVNVYYEGL